ncbi:hypothetical protein L9F63_002730, partial [Diploptera punctata]
RLTINQLSYRIVKNIPASYTSSMNFLEIITMLCLKKHRSMSKWKETISQHWLYSGQLVWLYCFQLYSGQLVWSSDQIFFPHSCHLIKSSFRIAVQWTASVQSSDQIFFPHSCTVDSLSGYIAFRIAVQWTASLYTLYSGQLVCCRVDSLSDIWHHLQDT